MAVPETALRHDHGSVARKDDIGFAGHCFVMQAEPKSGGMEPLTQDHFRFGVLRSDA